MINASHEIEILYPVCQDCGGTRAIPASAELNQNQAQVQVALRSRTAKTFTISSDIVRVIVRQVRVPY